MQCLRGQVSDERGQEGQRQNVAATSLSRRFWDIQKSVVRKTNQNVEILICVDEGECFFLGFLSFFVI